MQAGGSTPCDPGELAKGVYEDARGLQADVRQAQMALLRWQRWPSRIAILGFGLLAVPWTWYFLLQRIRELREAIIGR